jgi:hypothetical protein
VIQENRKPGTSAWRIPRRQSGPRISGYADHTAAHPGQRVRLYVSTQASRFRVEAFRMGYYGGKGARMVWHASSLPGHAQPHCPVTSGTYMVQCDWRPSLRVAIGKNWPTGDYLFKLTAAGGRQSYVPLTVTDPGSRATYVVMNSVLTWQAWNNYGGHDMYGGGRPGGPRTYAQRSRVLSFDRPYHRGHGASGFLYNEYPLVSFAEQHGLDVTYWTNITLGNRPAALRRHRALLSLGHDEQWSAPMRHAATAGRNHGVNLIFFAASPVLRKVRLQASPLGPDRQEVNYRDARADPEYGKNNAEVSQNVWQSPPANDPPSTLVGASYAGYGVKADMVVADPVRWLFAGTGLHAGSHIPDVIRFDYQTYEPSGDHPPHVQVLTRSPVAGHRTDPHAGSAPYADSTYYTWRPSHAGVFSTGTNYWIHAMVRCAPMSRACPAPAVRHVTGNLLHAFGTGPAGRAHPSP